MIRILLFTFSFFLTSAQSIAQTQAEINQEAANILKQSNIELNLIFQQILTEYKDDSVFLSAMRVSQQHWITFRDSELKMKYPDRVAGWYGSIQPMCISNYLTQITNERVETLKQWIIGTQEGDVCAGSISKYSDETETIEQIDDYKIITLLNELSFIKLYKTDELIIRIMSSPNTHGSAGFNSGEVTTNIWIAVSEYDELPEQNLYRVNSLYSPEIFSFDGSNQKEPKLTLQYIDKELKKITLQLSIEKMVQL